MSCDSFEHNKGTSSSEVRTKTVYFVHKSSILVAWINDGRPFFRCWGWDYLSLDKEFEGAASVILRCFFFWVRSRADAQWIVFFTFKYPFNSTLHDFKEFQLVFNCFFLWPRRKTLCSGTCQVLAVPFVSRDFQDGGTGINFERSWLIHCHVSEA